MFRVRSRQNSGWTSHRDTRLNQSSQSNIDTINPKNTSRLSEDQESERPEGLFHFKNRFLENLRQHNLVPNIAFDNHADSQLKCQCSVCTQDGVNRKEENKSPRKCHEFWTNFNFEAAVRSIEPEKDFVFVLKRLIPPKATPYNLRLSVPETVAFVDGEPKFVARTEKDKKIKFIQTKERLTFPEIRKFLQETQKRKENEQSMSNEKKQKVEIDPYKESLLYEKSEARSLSMLDSFGFNFTPKAKGNNVRRRIIS